LGAIELSNSIVIGFADCVLEQIGLSILATFIANKSLYLAAWPYGLSSSC
jgi:hypothetical protein